MHKLCISDITQKVKGRYSFGTKKKWDDKDLRACRCNVVSMSLSNQVLIPVFVIKVDSRVLTFEKSYLQTQTCALIWT